MNDHPLTKQLAETLFARGVTLPQMWNLVDIAGAAESGVDTVRTSRSDQQRQQGMIERLESGLGVPLLNPRASSSRESDDREDFLTAEGLALTEIISRFFDDLHAFTLEHKDRGRSIRIASSTTLLHWLVLPSIKQLQSHIRSFCKGSDPDEAALTFSDPRFPEISFRQIEREDVGIGLTSHSFHFAILRKSDDIKVDFLDASLGCPPDEMVEKWARWSDEQFATWAKKEGKIFRETNPHGHRRVGFVLGGYNYELCSRPEFWQNAVKLCKKLKRDLKDFLPIALCTNHPKFSRPLLDIENRRALNVAVRTDTWVESSELALHGDYATILPSIALKSLAPRITRIDAEALALPEEKVMLVFNPSILRHQIFRQMLSTCMVTMKKALNNRPPRPQEPAPTKQTSSSPTRRTTSSPRRGRASR